MGWWYQTRELNHAAVGGAGSGNVVLVPAVSGKKAVLMSAALAANGDTDIYIASSGGSALTAKHGTATYRWPLPADGAGFVLASEWGVCESEVGEPLVVILSAAVNIAGSVTYVYR